MATDNRGPVLLGLDVAFLATAVLANSLRCFVRLKIVKAFGTDDYLMACATVTFIIYCSLGITGVHYGTGQHYDDLVLENAQKAKFYWWLASLFYCVSMICSKLSIAFFLLRLSIQRLHTWIIYSAALITIASAISFFLVTLLQCHPVSYFWDKQQSGSCIDMNILIALGYVYSAFCIISDFTFTLLPISMVWNLQLRLSSKIAVIPLLTMGCIASFAVVARLPHIPEFASDDFLWDTLDIALWSTVEAGLAITAGSLATLRPLLQSCMHRMGFFTGRSERQASKYRMMSPVPPAAAANRNRLSRLRHNDAGFDDDTSDSVERQAWDEPSLEKGISSTAGPRLKVPESSFNVSRETTLSEDEDVSISLSRTSTAKDARGDQGPTPSLK